MDNGLQLTGEKQTRIPTRGHNHGGTKSNSTPSYVTRGRQLWAWKVGMDQTKSKRRQHGEDLHSLPTVQILQPIDNISAAPMIPGRH